MGTQILQKTANYFDPPPIINHYSLPLILAKTGRKIRLKLNWVFEYSWQQNLHWVSDEIFPCPVLNKNFQLGKVPSKIILLASEVPEILEVCAFFSLLFWSFLNIFKKEMVWKHCFNIPGTKLVFFGSGNPGEKFPEKFWASLEWLLCFCLVKGSDFVRIFCKFSLQTILIFFLCIY